MSDYTDPPRAASHWDPQGRAMWKAWTDSPLAGWMTDLDWAMLADNVSADQTARTEGALRADLRRVIDAKYENIRKLTQGRKDAADVAAQLPERQVLPEGFVLGLAELDRAIMYESWPDAVRASAYLDHVVRSFHKGDRPDALAHWELTTGQDGKPNGRKLWRFDPPGELPSGRPWPS